MPAHHRARLRAPGHERGATASQSAAAAAHRCAKALYAPSCRTRPRSRIADRARALLKHVAPNANQEDSLHEQTRYDAETSLRRHASGQLRRLQRDESAYIENENSPAHR